MRVSTPVNAEPSAYTPTLKAECLPGEQVTGGGFYTGGGLGGTESSGVGIKLLSSRPGPGTWEVQGFNTSPYEIAFVAYAVCADLG